MPTAPKRSKPAKNEGIKKPIRVPRACDNCRLRKSKCDGLLPCSFCQLHDSECTYDNSRPKKQLDTKYIVSLERSVDRLKALIGIPPEIEVTSELLDEYENNQSRPPPVGSSSRSGRKEHVSTQTSRPSSSRSASPIARTLLESMIEATGQLNIDEDGNYDYSGNCSGLVLVERIRERCDSLLDRRSINPPGPGHLQRSHSGTPSSRSLSHSRTRQRPLTILPTWDVATRYINIAFAESFSLLSFIHRPTFEVRLNEFYAARNAGLELTADDIRFEALLNSIFALGESFGGVDELRRDDTSARGIRAEEFFQIAQKCLDMTECRDLSSLQALLCSTIYLQGTGQLPLCYTYLSLAMTAAIRMGMHQADSLSKFNTIERETRKRIFWSLRVMDSYITTVLDLPRTLTDDETDQSYPQDADDMYITPQGIKPFTGPCLMASVNAHTRLTRILSKVRQIASGKEHDHKPNNRYQVDYAKIVEAEQDLTAWSSKLQTHTRFPDHMRREMERSQLLLRVAHAHVQMVLYRPFLHHIGRRNTDTNFDYRAFACASACVKAAMQVIWLSEALNDAHLLNGPVWLLFFTLFMAVVSSIMFVITNKDDPSAAEYYSAAQRGFTILEKFANSNQMARNYTESLRPLFCRTSRSDCGSEDSEMAAVPPTTIPPAFRSSNSMLKVPSFTFEQAPTPTIFRPNVANDVYLGAPHDSMNFMNPVHTRPLSIAVPGPTLPSMDDSAAQQVYLQAMNCTPTNFFEGFSSETAMMDYFSWQQDAGPSNTGGFQFQQ